MSGSLSLIRNLLGHAHPIIVHFPVALLLTGAGLETWGIARKHPCRSHTARVLLALGTLAAAGAVVSGLSLFRSGDFMGRTLAVARIHRWLGVSVGSAALVTLGIGELGSSPEGRRLTAYRSLYLLTALVTALAGHYGGWVVFGWGWTWTP
jgi:uncharacterized membrane protein